MELNRQRSDGYHKWLVLVSAFIAMSFTLGYFFSQGALFAMVMKRFGSSRTEVSLMQSLSSSTCYASGILVGPFIQKIGLRKACIVGTLISTSSLCVCAFGTIIQHLIYAGIFLGLGVSIMLVGTMKIVGQHFEGHRFSALVMGIFMSNSSVGGTFFPFLAQYLEDHFGLPGVFLVEAGLFMHPFAFVMLWSSPANDPSEANVEDVKTSNTSREVQLYQDDKVDKSTCDKNTISAVYNINADYIDDNESNTKQISQNFEFLNDVSGKSEGNIQSLLDLKQRPKSNALKEKSPLKIFRSLICEKSLWAYILAHAVSQSFMSAFRIFIVDIMLEHNFRDSDGALGLMLYSVSNGIGRIVLGLLVSVPEMPPLGPVIIFTFASGLYLIAMTFSMNLNLWLVLLCLFSFSHGMCIGGGAVTTVQLFGVEYLPFVVGMLYTLSSAGFGLSGPLLGYLRDTSKDYSLSLYTAAGFCALASVLFLLSHILDGIRPAKQKEKNIQ